jgi:hypothetical protein
MLASTAGPSEAMQADLVKVFTVYAIFWVVVIVGLVFAVGFLLKRQEQLLRKHHGDQTHSH